ncbi:efflux RND transporter periplasmic adaptor subunit [Mordavella massiliensis]|uniref:HlyD family efflux transporter periplasmic adaptor subunit n=1 Tax=Mordavella massiliensis TaxID=1871024 RepID=A0A939BGM2_9CLOT|nr:HlyD family efflux transporter periplasmic adaptor subunit [Mordavella massiliensis]MBM6948220.1 HlyD family efflux transporter periplasmic adaptor subunit [Mordavella massiliensis]
MGKTSAADNKKKKGKRVRRILLCAAVLLAAGTAAFILVPRLAGRGNENEITTSYLVDEVTVGDVSSTVSGSGTLSPISQQTLTAEFGAELSSVNFSAGDSVSEGEVIAVIDSDARGSREIKAPYDGILTEVPVRAGDSVSAGGEVAMIMGKDGFTLDIAVDELDIAAIEQDQEVAVSIDAVSGEQTGTVSEISYNGSSNGGTTAYQATVKLDYVEDVYPGMSASAEIVTEDSGEGMIVPVEAVGTSGDDSYVCLAPEGAEAGDVYEEDDLDPEKLTKVTVETGMSDGTYIRIDSEELEEGDLIVITQVTSSLTGQEEGAQSSGQPGEFPDGMDFGDFDFGDIDPSELPEGGGPGGMFPGGGSY